MAKIRFKHLNFHLNSLKTIKQANAIIDEYMKLGYKLTLRQLYYQFVTHKYIENDIKQYKKLGRTISDARLCGLIDWDSIEDRVRNIYKVPTWLNAYKALDSAIHRFAINLWSNQPNYIEVWVEKDALSNVIFKACSEFRVPFFACRGYTSQSEMMEAGYYRLRSQWEDGKEVTIIHLGDHDPSGIDMSRDITERLAMFVGVPIEINRIALNMNQVEELDLPPDPAKISDVRFNDYAAKYGGECWELDALNPIYIYNIIEKEIIERIDHDQWNKDLAIENTHKETLQAISSNFDKVNKFLREVEHEFKFENGGGI